MQTVGRATRAKSESERRPRRVPGSGFAGGGSAEIFTLLAHKTHAKAQLGKVCAAAACVIVDKFLLNLSNHWSASNPIRTHQALILKH